MDAPQLLIIVGIMLLIIEVVVLGFSSFILVFIGLSLITSGLCAWANLLPLSWNAILIANVVLTAGFASLLWRPLLKLQNRSDNNSVASDFDGHTFLAPGVIHKQSDIQYSYSGIHWTLKSEHPIKEGDEVEVVKAEVGIFWVKPTKP